MSETIPVRLTDTDILHRILADREGEWVGHEAILTRCRLTTGHGMTVHSRAASLRKKGYDVQCRMETVNGRKQSYYRLVSA